MFGSFIHSPVRKTTTIKTLETAFDENTLSASRKKVANVRYGQIPERRCYLNNYLFIILVFPLLPRYYKNTHCIGREHFIVVEWHDMKPSFIPVL